MQGSGPSKLAYPLVSHPMVKFREGCCPFVGNGGVKFREGSGLSNLTHPFVANAGKWPFSVGLPFGEPPEVKV